MPRWAALATQDQVAQRAVAEQIRAGVTNAGQHRSVVAPCIPHHLPASA